MSWLRVLVAVAENVVLPVAAYLVLTMVGWAPVWALVGASAVSVIVLGVGYSRTRELSTLGVLVLGRFTVGIAVALVTGDPRLELAKDFAITGLIGVLAGVSLGWRRPDAVPDATAGTAKDGSAPRPGLPFEESGS